MNRRTMLRVSAFGAAVMWLQRAEPMTADAARLVSIAEFSASGARLGITDVAKLVKPESEWRRQLTPLSFEVARHADTERPFHRRDLEPARQGHLSLHLL
jgi:peptide-methionine (R)-S-oxide reductase